MGLSETASAPPGADHPQEKRTCAKCSAEKVVTPETWPYRKGRTGQYQAHGARCLECEKKRKAEYEARRDKIAVAIQTPPPDKEKGDKRKERLDVTAALKAGGHVLNTYAPSALARLLEYAEDPESEHHQWALELLLQRILPRKLFEELGGQAAGVGALTDKRPQVIVNVLPTGGAAPGVTYENGEGAASGMLSVVATPALEAPEEQPDPFS